MELSGKTFGKLLIGKCIGYIIKTSSPEIWEPEYECVCSCGRGVLTPESDLTEGLEVDCGQCTED